jgi:hypothetical protein
MALLEYDIHYANGESTVTCRVLEVDSGDRIRFKSKHPRTGIQYKNDTPFDDPAAPQANQVFEVDGTTEAFTVVKPLTPATRIHFDCGEIAAAAPRGSGLQSWGIGNGTPPDF